jgi:hypothetical protein
MAFNLEQENKNNEKIKEFLTNVNFSQIFFYLTYRVVEGNNVLKIKASKMRRGDYGI